MGVVPGFGLLLHLHLHFGGHQQGGRSGSSFYEQIGMEAPSSLPDNDEPVVPDVGSDDEGEEGGLHTARSRPRTQGVGPGDQKLPLNLSRMIL